MTTGSAKIGTQSPEKLFIQTYILTFPHFCLKTWDDQWKENQSNKTFIICNIVLYSIHSGKEAGLFSHYHGELILGCLWKFSNEYIARKIEKENI